MLNKCKQTVFIETKNKVKRSFCTLIFLKEKKNLNTETHKGQLHKIEIISKASANNSNKIKTQRRVSTILEPIWQHRGKTNRTRTPLLFSLTYNFYKIVALNQVNKGKPGVWIGILVDPLANQQTVLIFDRLFDL